MAQSKGKRGQMTKDKILTMQKTHKTDAAIGKEFGITRQAVYQFRKKLGLSFNREKYRERDQAIVKKYKSGISGTKIADEFKLSISQTYRIIKRG
jgi:transposase